MKNFNHKIIYNNNIIHNIMIIYYNLNHISKPLN